MGLARVWLLRRSRRMHNFRSKLRFLIMKIPQRVTLLQLERKPLFVYTTAGLSKVWIRYDIRDSARLITIGTSFVQPECLPPTSAAAVYHSLRLYHQVQQWRGVALPPLDWGWKLVDGRLLPVRTDLQAAHVSLLEIIRCNCKSDCGSQRCSCRKHGMDCSAACGFCRGQSYTNSASPDLSENDE